MNDLGVFLAATLALNLTPGPDMLYVITRSATEGRAAGIVSSFGIATGCVVHTIIVAVGLAGLLAAVPAAFTAVRFAGAGYLMYLGVRRMLARPGLGPEVLPPAPLGTVYRQGVITNVLNPKVALFFLAFLPQFVDRSAGGVSLQLAGLGTLFNVSGTIVNVLVALAASGTVRWTRGSAIPEWAARASGLVFVALGVRLAWRR